MSRRGTVKATPNTSSEHESRREAELILLRFSPGWGSERRPKTRSTRCCPNSDTPGGTVKATANTSSEHESVQEAELILLSFLPGKGSENRPKTRST